MLKEFKEFAVKGNMLDMAVGIIIGAAFGTVIKSLVSDLLMPPIGMAMGGVDFANLFVVLGDGGTFETLAQAQEAGAVTLNIGLFLNAVIAFVIVAFSVFLVVKSFNKAKRSMEAEVEEAPAAPEAPPADIALLTEIRDLLRNQG